MTAATSRRFSKPVTVADARPHDIVVVSDLHVGEDLVESGPPSLQRYIQRLNLEFEQFMEHVRARARQRPVRFIINGDFIDFVKISVRPSADDAPWALNDEERRFGPNNEPEKIVWKFERVLEAHRPMFMQLALLVGEGNDLIILPGNHDADFHWDRFKQVFRERLGDLCIGFTREERGGLSPADEAGIRARMDAHIHFVPWFYVQDDLLYVEHGHQYDEFSSFRYQLHPVDGDRQEVAMPLSHRPMRYFADLLGDFSTHELDNWTFALIARLAFGRGLWWGVKLAAIYLFVTVDLLILNGRGRHARWVGSGPEHERRLAELAERSQVPVDVLRQLDRLSAPPAEYSLLKMVTLFYLDRFLLLVALLLSSTLALAVPDTTFVTSVWLSLNVGVAVGANQLLSRVRRYDTKQKLRDVALRLGSLMGVRYVIMGHSHLPEGLYVGEAHGETPVFYVNSGTWVPRSWKEPTASDGGMTYVHIVLAEPEPRAQVLRWRGPNLEPQILADLNQQLLDQRSQAHAQQARLAVNELNPA